MRLTNEQREALERYVFDGRMTSFFNEELKTNYIMNGFPSDKGIRYMSDDELFKEATHYSSLDEVKKFIKSVKSKIQKYDVSIQIIRSYVLEVEAKSKFEAVEHAEGLNAQEIDRQAEHIDTFIDVDEDADLCNE